MRSIIEKSLSIALFAIALVGFPATAQEGDSRWSFGFEAGIRWDDNIGLTPSDPAEQAPIPQIQMFDDTTTMLSGTVNFDLLRASGKEFIVSATPFYNLVSDLDGLTNYGVTVEAVYRGEFGSDFTDPWFSAMVGYTIAEFDDSRIRDGGWLEGELTLGKRFSPAFGLSLGARFVDRSQANSTLLCPTRGVSNGECPDSWDADKVFEQDRQGLFVHADFSAGDKTGFFLEYTYWDGDSSSSGAFPGTPRDNIADDDTAFGIYNSPTPNNPGRLRPFRVWKIDATQHVIEAGITRQLGENWSVGLTYIYLNATDVISKKRDPADRDLSDYDNDVIELVFTFGGR